MNIWKILKIDPTNDKRAIKRAYAKLLKQNNPEDNPSGFQTLRDAYDRALSYCETAQADIVFESDPGSQVVTAIIDESGPQFEIDQDQSYEEQTNSHEKEPSKARARQERTERIHDAATQVVHKIKLDEKAAIKFCEELLSQDFFQALDVRYEFEGELLIILCDYPDRVVKQKFYRYLAEEFAWDIDLRRHHEIIHNHFSHDQKYSTAFYNYLIPILRDSIRRKAIQNYGILYKQNNVSQEVEQILFLDHNAAKLEKLKTSKRFRQTALRYVEYLKKYDYLNSQICPIPYETYSWLYSNQIIQSAGVNQDSNKGKTGSIWTTVFFFVLLFVGLTSFLSNFDNRKFSTNSPEPAVNESNESFAPRSGQLKHPDQSSPKSAFVDHSEAVLTSFEIEGLGNYQGYAYADSPHGKGRYEYENGDSFDGEFEHEIRIKGTYIWSDGKRFYGEFKDDLAYKGEWQYTNGDSFRGAKIDDRLMEGFYTMASGDRFSGKILDGVFEVGYWKFASGAKLEVYIDDGQIVARGNLPGGEEYKGGWESNRAHGKGRIIYANGDTFEGKFVSGQKDYGVYTWLDGGTYTGKFVDGSPAEGRYVYSNGDTFRGVIENSMLIGKYFIKAQNATFIGEKQIGELTGNGRLYIGDLVYKGNFIHGAIVGEGELIDAEGTTYTGEFVAGKREGKFKVVDLAGTHYITKFKNDKRVRPLERVKL